jgi:hypothetical protein
MSEGVPAPTSNLVLGREVPSATVSSTPQVNPPTTSHAHTAADKEDDQVHVINQTPNPTPPTPQVVTPGPTAEPPQATPRTTSLADAAEVKHEQARAIKRTPNVTLERQLERVVRARAHDNEGPPLVPGMDNAEFWSMRRRFDIVRKISSLTSESNDDSGSADFPESHIRQQICHALSPPLYLPKGEIDLRPSTLPAVPFRPNIVKSNAERAFITVGFKGMLPSFPGRRSTK